MLTTFNEFNIHTTADQVLADIDLSNKRYLITGANSGLGAEAARSIAAHGASLVLTVRSDEKANALKKQLNRDVPEAKIDIRQLDLSSLKNIRTFTEQIKKEGITFNGILGNAGIMATDFAKTEDGFEQQFGTNHLGHFLLINRLIDTLEENSRVVMMSSGAHRLNDVDLTDPNFEHRDYDRWVAYGQSKSSNALFSLALDNRYKDWGIRSFTVAPGIVLDTNLHTHLTEKDFAGLKARQNTDNVPRKTIGAGAATQVMALCHPVIEGYGGLFLEHCAFAQVNADTTLGTGVIPWVLDLAHAEEVWVLSEKLVNEHFTNNLKIISEKEIAVSPVLPKLAKNRLPSSDVLVGTTLILQIDEKQIILDFKDNELCTWQNLPGIALAQSGIAIVDVVECRPEVYFIDLIFPESPSETITIAADKKNHAALIVSTRIGERRDQIGRIIKMAMMTKFHQDFYPAAIVTPGIDISSVTLPEKSNDFIGQREIHLYDDGNTAYEHIYINSRWYCYHNVQGVRKGDASCDEISYYKISDKLYVVTFREIQIDVSFVHIYDMDLMRTTGKAWGSSRGGIKSIYNSPAGAFIKTLGSTHYPDNYQPV